MIGAKNVNNFWRTTQWLEYLQNSKLRVSFNNHSFFYKGELIPLLQEGDQLFSPGFDDKKEILQQIKQVALENNIKRIQVNSEIKEYLDMSGYTCILSLDKINLTKGHRSLINKAKKHLTLEILNETEQFMLDYFKIAEKITRPEKTFRILQDWITQGHGTLLKALHQNDTAGYVYILHYKDQSYYFASCTFDEYKPCGANHFLLWNAFELLKNKGIKHFELGEQFYNSLHHQPTQKELNISKFKKSFGGNIVRRPMSEYFFDKVYLKKTMHNRIDKYIEKEL